jgi:hypothetical protein
MKKKLFKQTLKNCMFKEKHGDVIIKMQFVGFFFCVNNDKEVDAKIFEVMRCLFCYTSLVHAYNPKTIERKVLI